MSAGFKVVAEAAEQQSHPSSVDYCSLWSFICPRMNGRQRQQAVILQATTAVPDPRWNETSNSKTPIRNKTPVTLVDWGSELIWRLVITTVHDADIQSLSVRPGSLLIPPAMQKKRLVWWGSDLKSIPRVPSRKVESYWVGERREEEEWGHREWGGENDEEEVAGVWNEEEEEARKALPRALLMIRDNIVQEGECSAFKAARAAQSWAGIHY